MVPGNLRNGWRNVKGRYDLMRFLCKWDPDYRKDVIITFLAYMLLIYSTLTWNTYYDWIAMAVEATIIAVQVGGEMSILPADYRPSHGGVRYTVQPSTHIAYEELSFLMSGVYPAEQEEALGFANPLAALALSKESPLVSDRVNDLLMTRTSLPVIVDEGETNHIRSRHQLRYIAIRVANKKQHTTNGVKLALYDMADALAHGEAVHVRKSYYFDALLTAEAFRSRIFRNNIKGEKEVYTDLTTYFPVREEEVNGEDSVRFLPDLYKYVSGHIGITTLLVTENNRVAMLHQGGTKAVGSHTVTLGGSGSMNFSDMELAKNPDDLRYAIAYGMAREMSEETRMEKRFEGIRANTMVTGFFRWIDRCGKPEFVGLTRAGNVPFAASGSVDGDEVVKFEEIPVTLNSVADFPAVFGWLRDQKVNVSLSSLMALHRMVVIAGYGPDAADPAQRAVYQRVSDFLFPPSA
ncbi:MAG TPA: hypothetical protein VEF76_08755 [Patescibacteria group bacterium]|nr:hypothetical protein [Patescibacteria group bacterium]